MKNLQQHNAETDARAALINARLDELKIPSKEGHGGAVERETVASFESNVEFSQGDGVPLYFVSTQERACLRGEHVTLGDESTETQRWYAEQQVRPVRLCKHCRAVFVPR